MTGEIHLLQKKTTISDTETAVSLHDKLSVPLWAGPGIGNHKLKIESKEIVPSKQARRQT